MPNETGIPIKKGVDIVLDSLLLLLISIYNVSYNF